MSVEIFSKEQFEKNALPVHKVTKQPLWKYIGLVDGEHAYLIALPNNNVGIEVRSSVRSNGFSADTGKDSIRCWLVDCTTKKPMGSKISRWTTRVPGWGERTKEVIRQLWTIGTKLVDCPTCKNTDPTVDSRLRCFKVKKEGPNKGRLFLRCPIETCKHFEWLAEDDDAEVRTKNQPEPKQENFEDFSKPINSNPKTLVFTVEVPATMKDKLDELVTNLGGRVWF